MYFLYRCYTVLGRSLILFLFTCRNGRTPSRRMQVSPLSSWSTKAGGWHHFAISRFPVSPVLHHFPDALLKLLLWSGGSLWFWAKKESMISGGRLKWSLGARGWTICEFKSPFNICPSQRDMGRGERSGRRWEGFWSLVPLWHIGNGSWFPPILLSPFVFLVHLPVGIFAVFICPFLHYPHKPLLFSLIRFSPSLITFTYTPFISHYWSLALTITRPLSFPGRIGFKTHLAKIVKGQT